MGDDLERLQGIWSVSRLEVEGQLMQDTILAGAKISVKGDRFTSTGMGAVYEGTLELDSSAKPHHLDMKFDTGPEKGNTNLGIYKFDGDTWKLCLATRGDVRPSRFASIPGSGFVLQTLTRGNSGATGRPKAAAGSAVSRAATTSITPATEFEGEWPMVSAVMNGAEMEKSAVQWVKRVTVGNESTVYAGPQVIAKVRFTHDSTKSPKTIDYVNTAGSNKGKTQLGIYEIARDVLKICMAAPGSGRPTKFESVRGEGATFTVWKRAGGTA